MDYLKIKSTNIELTDAIDDYVRSKVSDIDKFIDPDDESVLFEVEVGKTTNHHMSGDIFRAEVNLRIAGNNLRVVSEKDNLYAAIDDVKDDMLRRLTDEKKKETSLIRKGARKFKEIMRGFGDK